MARPQASVCSCPPACGRLLPLVLHLNNKAPWGRDDCGRDDCGCAGHNGGEVGIRCYDNDKECGNVKFS